MSEKLDSLREALVGQISSTDDNPPAIYIAAVSYVTGLAGGFFVLVFWLSNVRSFGQPYFRMFTDERSPSGMKSRGEVS